MNIYKFLKAPNAIAMAFVAMFSAFHAVNAQSLEAKFEMSTNTACGTTPIKFTDKSTGEIDSWTWDFGRGTSDIVYDKSENPAITFEPGEYTIVLTVKRGTESSSYSQQLSIYEIPKAKFTLSAESGCVNTEFQFADATESSASISSYTWFFGDGEISNQKNPKHAYKESRKYTIGMTIVDAHGCSDNQTFTDYIEVTEPLNLNISATQTQSCEAPLTTTFTPTVSGGVAATYLWDFGDGETSTEVSPSHTYSSDGSYTVKLTAGNAAACENTISKDNFININTSTVDFTITGPLCVNNELVFAGGSNSTINTWSWNFGDGSSASDASVSKTYDSEGTYNVTVTAVNDFGCTLVQSKTIEIHSSPVVSVSSDKVHGCEEDDYLLVNFNDNTTGGAKWSWDFGDGETSEEKSPAHKYTQVGVFNAVLTVTDQNSCSATSEPIKITKMNPMSSFSIESDDDGKFCLGSTVTLSESVVSDFTITDYLWEPLYDVSKETSRSESGNNLIIVYGETGEYPLSLTVKDEDGCIGKMEDTVKIGKKPVLPTIVTENKCYKDVKENGLDFTVTPNDDANNWYWDFGDNNKKMVYEDMVNHIYDAPKDYHVTVLAKQYYCPADMAEIDIIVKAPSAEFAPNPEAMCDFPGDITFDPSASQGAETYLWDFGDGTDKIFVEALAEEGHFKWTNQTTGDVISEDSTSNVVVHTYQKSNKYDVKLVTSTDECEDDKTQTLNLSGIIPGFFPDTVYVCMGVPVTFTDTSMSDYGQITNRRWIFDEDTVNTAEDTYQYAFSKAGTFDVSVKIDNQFGCTDSLTKTSLITVYPLPDVTNFDEKNEYPFGCADFEVEFKSYVTPSPVAALKGYLWNFGDGTTSEEQVPTHTYSAGIFDVSLKVTDENNCTDEMKKTQYIHSNKPSSTFQSENLICYDADFLPFITAVEAITYTWDWGDETAQTEGNAPEHSYNDVTVSDTTYTVTLTATDTIGCFTTTSKDVVVRRPRAQFSATDSIFTCPPAKVNFINQSKGTNLSYLWNLPSTVENPYWAFYTSGNYDISLTVTDDEGCVDVAVKPAYISVSGPRGTLETNQLTGCTYDTIHFYGREIFGAVKGTWYFDDGRYAVAEDVDSAIYSYKTGGNYIPSLVLEDENGCTVTVLGSKLTVYGVDLAFKTDSILCEPSTVEIKNTSISQPNEVDSWEWVLSTGDTFNTKDISVDLGYGDFNLSLTANINSCMYTMDSSSFLKILRTLDSQFETSQNPAKTMEMVTFTNTTDTAFGMPVFSIWDYGTGDTSSVFDGSHSYINAGDYTVSLTTFVHEECPNTFSMPITIVKEYLIPNVFTPNGDGINDRFLENMPEVELIILNRWGQQVYKGFDGWDGTFNGQEMSAGTYYYLITLPNGDHFEGPLMLIRN